MAPTTESDSDSATLAVWEQPPSLRRHNSCVIILHLSWKRFECQIKLDLFGNLHLHFSIINGSFYMYIRFFTFIITYEFIHIWNTRFYSWFRMCLWFCIACRSFIVFTHAASRYMAWWSLAQYWSVFQYCQIRFHQFSNILMLFLFSILHLFIFIWKLTVLCLWIVYY